MKRLKLSALFLLISLCLKQNVAAMEDTINSFVVSSTETSNTKESRPGSDSTEINTNVPQIYQMYVKSNISNRFAHTTVTSKVRNLANKAQEATFSVILPESAFISGFVMEVNGKNYTAYVKEKEEAKRTYDEAVTSGRAAAHLAVSARDSNRFTVSVNVEAETKAVFYLTYEELLKRKDGHYELVINLHPGQPVKDLSVEVAITESRKITDLKAPPLRSGNEIGNNNSELDSRADVETINDTAAVVRFTPNLERQKQLAHILGTNENDGLSGQFVVQYDVERDPKGGEVLLLDGYFVHFFAPTELAALPKHVVFVLDTSSSMSGNEIRQLKEAMHKILEQLHDNDLFNLVEFNTNTKVWDLNDPDSSFQHRGNEEINFSGAVFPTAYLANADNIRKAKAITSNLQETGLTDIYSALKIGLHVVKLGKSQNTETINRQPIIVFLTDGDPTIGLTSTEEIVNKITEWNSEIGKVPIFALSFGDGADKNFLQKLALRNLGFSRHIYEAADASLQLQDFYQQISSPLLANVTFKYEPSITSLTKTEFPIHFAGSELVVAGFYDTEPGVVPHIHPAVEAWNGHKRISFQPIVQRSVSNVERLWAYLTVKQLLEHKEISDDDKEELKKKALDLALKYSFVTAVSSLVVVKPNAADAVDTEAAVKKQHAFSSGRRYNSISSAHSDGLFVAGFYSAPSYHSGRHVHADLSGPNIGPRDSYLRFGGGGGGVGGGRGGGGGFRYEGSSSRHSAGIPLSAPAVSINPLPTTTATDTPDLSALPWLKDILNANGKLNLPTGEYKLGWNETLPRHHIVVCPNSPLNAPGYCTLLHSCPEVHSRLTSVNIFVNHFCDLNNGYAGVCCPN